MRLKDSIREINPTEEILNEELIGQAIGDCLKEKDFEGMIEIINIYLEASKKHSL